MKWLNSLFMTITNANFEYAAIEKQIRKMISIRNEMRSKVKNNASGEAVINFHDAANFEVDSRSAMIEKGAATGVLSTENEDIRSLREMITYGLKGMAAYAEHAAILGKENLEISAFIYEALAAMLDDSLTADDLVALTLRTGEYGVKAIWLYWTKANTSKFGNPEITEVNIGVRKNPAILISGHDLNDLNSFLSRQREPELTYTLTERCSLHIIILLLKVSAFRGQLRNAWWSK